MDLGVVIRLVVVASWPRSTHPQLISCSVFLPQGLVTQLENQGVRSWVDHPF
jgi:hypothetical protein